MLIVPYNLCAHWCNSGNSCAIQFPPTWASNPWRHHVAWLGKLVTKSVALKAQKSEVLLTYNHAAPAAILYVGWALLLCSAMVLLVLLFVVPRKGLRTLPFLLPTTGTVFWIFFFFFFCNPNLSPTGTSLHVPLLAGQYRYVVFIRFYEIVFAFVQPFCKVVLPWPTVSVSSPHLIPHLISSVCLPSHVFSNEAKSSMLNGTSQLCHWCWSGCSCLLPAPKA